MTEPIKGGFAAFSNIANPFKPNAISSPSTAPATGGFANTSTTPTTSGTLPTTNAFGGSSNGGLSAFASNPTNAFGGGSTPAPNSLFGNTGSALGTSATNPAQTATAAPAAGLSAFSSGSSAPALSLFGAKPAEQTSTTQNPTNVIPSALAGSASSGSFGTPATSQPISSTMPAPSKFFAIPPKPTDATPTATPAGPTLPSITSLFGKPSTPAPATSSGTSTATGSQPPSFLSAFGAKKIEETGKDKDAHTQTAPPANLFDRLSGGKDSASATGAGATPTSIGTSGSALAKDGEKKDGTSASTTTPLFGAATNKDPLATSATPAVTGVASSTVTMPPPSMLRGKTIEEIVNKWSSDLELHVREFGRLAGEIAVWDRTLIDNGNTIAALFQHILLAEQEQSDVEQSLKHVEAQQKELGATLDVYEKSVGELFDNQSGGLRSLDVGPADAERDKHYTLAADVNTSLDDLSHSLSQMIEAVNALSDPAGDVTNSAEKNETPLDQIAQILSSHLDSLQWIDTAVREVETKVTDVEKRIREVSTGSNGAASSVSGSNGISRPRGFAIR